MCLRRGRDSNPRYPYEYGGFQDRSIQPLWHPSFASGKDSYSDQSVGIFNTAGTLSFCSIWVKKSSR